MTTFPLPKAVLDQHSLVLGKTRSGKSSTMRVMVERLLDDKKPVCIIDPKGDWWGIKSSADGKKAGYDVVIFGGTHADVPINAQSGKVVAELVATGNRPALIDLGGWMVGERTRFFIDFASTLFTKTHGHRWLVIDECHNFAPQGKVQDPQAGMSLHWANRLASEGAGKGVVLISASQRPQKVHKDYVTSHETLIAKRVIHPLDRDAMKEWIDGCGDPAKGKEVLDSLAGLQKPQGWVWSPEIDFGPKLVTFPMFKTYDSFAVQTGKAGRKLKGWASVDLDDVKAKLATVVEEAKANDPKELRAQVAELKREIAKLTYKSTVPASPAKPDKDAIATVEKRGFELAEKKLRGAMERELRKRLKDTLGMLRGYARKFVEQIEGELEAVNVREAKAEAVTFTPSPVPAASAPRLRMSIVPHKRAVRGSDLVDAPLPPIVLTIGDTVLTGPMRQCLQALAWWSAMGHQTPTRAQVAAICGWKSKGSNLRNRLAELSAAGLIVYPQTGIIHLTDAGAAAAPSPDTGTTLIDSIRAACTGPMLTLFDALLAFHNEGRSEVTREMIGERVGWEASGSNLRNRLAELSAIEVIGYPRKGEVSLQGWVTEMRAAA
jgi:hypothetical protein